MPATEFTILHLSDVHFGTSDYRAEMPRVTEAIVDAVKKQDWPPDIIILSGDLAFSGLDGEFMRVQTWLERFMQLWNNTKLFIVPGNHDVVRRLAKLVLRQAYVDPQTYASMRDRLHSDVDHLGAFFNWHRTIKQQYDSFIISDWSSPFGCNAIIRNDVHSLQFVGLNTSLLSCDNDDRQRLVQDVQILNGFLGEHRDDTTCVIVVGHHPLSWLVQWNADEVAKILHQRRGAHIYMHGHNHDNDLSTISNATGTSLTILQGGAAYQGSEWNQYFSLYRLMFRSRNIAPRTYVYNTCSGDWLLDNAKSQIFLATIPLFEHVDFIENDMNINNDGDVSIKYTDIGIDSQIELDARRAIDNAKVVYDLVMRYITDAGFIGRQVYSITGRIKNLDRIIQKTQSRRQKDHNYSVAQVEDVCGFRCVCLYQSDIPYVVSKVLTNASRGRVQKSPFRVGTGVKVTIHTSRPHNDPLSIVAAIKNEFERWGHKHEIDIRSQPTGYSSIHIVVKCVARRDNTHEITMPVEFQIRSGLEEFWGQLDHKLRYETNRGAVGNSAWQRHLNVLKAQFDAVIQYVDLIKEASEQVGTQVAHEMVDPATAPSQRSLSTTDRQLSMLKDLPIDIYEEVKRAFDLWEAADVSRTYGGEPNKFRLAADKFKPFMNGLRDIVKDELLSARLEYISSMERAFMLQATQDQDALNEAKEIYVNRIKYHGNDVSALFRLGQVMVEQKNIEEGVEKYEEAIRIIDAGEADDPVDAKSRVYDLARLGLAMSYWRKAEEKQGGDEQQVGFIEKAIKLSKDVYECGNTVECRGQALNDLLYYAWDEHKRKQNRYAQCIITQEEFGSMVKELDKIIEGNMRATYRLWDTLARGKEAIGDVEGAVEAAREVCCKLEKAAQERSGGLANLELQRFGGRWVASVINRLLNDDEKDALYYALDLIEGAQLK